ncbi:PREDICTED: FCH domain only protein 1-like, partial [Chaetura pelagica]|uniref:FCH domain only protein 1-like n=1 Tax=Chaetura pelagica TaxID=8897 RepID=UPI0005238137
RTFAPLWEVFRISSDKLALCHLELMKKLHDLIKEISRYGEEQGRVHKKRFQEVEEAHLRHMKGLIGSYSHSVEDTHVQIGQVHEEFKQNVENIGTEMLLRRFAESKGTGRERPGALDFDEYRLAPAQEGPKRSRSKAFRIPGLGRKERDRDAGISLQGCPEVDEDGFTVRPDVAHSILAGPPGCSSSDSDYDEDEPRKFYVHIKPVQPREAGGSTEATVEQLKATVGNLILPPSIGGTVKRHSSRHVASVPPAPSDTDPEGTLAAGDGAGRGCLAAQVNSDPSQSDPSTRDFWLNMAALTGHLQKQAEQSPAASYYNVALLKYQFSRLGPVSVQYGYNAGALALPVPLANVHVLLPMDEPITNLRLQPTASWNLEEKRLLWKLLDVPGAPGQGGCGRLSASWEPLCGPSKPSPVAAQFSSEGSTLSGVEVELASAGYRMSLVKKRFATGIYLAGS